MTIICPPIVGRQYEKDGDSMDRDTVIGSVIESYKRLKEEDSNHELLGFMTLYPLSDEPLWERARQAEFLRRFGDGVVPKYASVSTGTMKNYWKTLQSASERIVIGRLEQHIETVGAAVERVLTHVPEPVEVQCNGTYSPSA